MLDDSANQDLPGDDRPAIAVGPADDVAGTVAAVAGRCELTHDDNGRPVLRPLQGGPSGPLSVPAVSLAYSGGLVAVAAARAPIGVDLEVVRAFPAAAAIVMRRFAAAETAQWRGSGSDQAGFWWLWTRKEAVAKAIGVALPSALRMDVRPASIMPTGAPEGQATGTLRLWTWQLATSVGPAILSAAVVDAEGLSAAPPTVSGAQSTPSADLPASNRATGTRNGEQDT